MKISINFLKCLVLRKRSPLARIWNLKSFHPTLVCLRFISCKFSYYCLHLCVRKKFFQNCQFISWIFSMCPTCEVWYICFILNFFIGLNANYSQYIAGRWCNRISSDWANIVLDPWTFLFPSTALSVVEF